MNTYKNCAHTLAKEVGQIMREYFRSDVNERTWKSDDTPVTIADQKINDLVQKRIAETFPEHGFLGEEGGVPDGQEYVWVCDPIDGTRSFARGIPVSVFSLALVHDGKPILGVVYQPFLDELYAASEGEGATMNGEKIEVSDLREIGHDVLVTAPSHRQRSLYPLEGHLSALATAGASTYNYGSATYNAVLVARGSADMTFFPWPSPWDVSAAKIIIEEAGGHTSNIEGGSQRYDAHVRGFYGSNGMTLEALHKQLKNGSIDV